MSAGNGRNQDQRHLRDEDRELWTSVTRTLRPLRPMKNLEIDPSKAEGSAKKTERHPVPASPAANPAAGRAKSGPPPLAPLDRRLKQQLGRGRHPIDARMDLHGLTLDRAHDALLNFLRRAQTADAKIVLVITGKGGESHDPFRERGVLRRQVPLWLKLPGFRELVVGFEAAHAGHGGEGALYVRIRRRRAR